MIHEPVKEKSIWILIIIGILIAILSALENHWEWLASICGSFSSGCSEVRNFTFMSVQIAYWGIAFYLLLAAINAFARGLRFWIIMAAMGAEITFLWTMYSLDMPCLFCLLNGVVVFLLFILLLDKKMLWQAAAICVIGFLASNFALTKENRKLFEATEAQVNPGRTPTDTASKHIENAEDKPPAREKATTDPNIDLKIENSPTFGPSDATVTIVEYSDYMCPACRRLHPTASKLRERYRDKVKWVFKDFPLKQHEGAERLAEAARCAWEQDKFWEFQDELFNISLPVDFNLIAIIAETLGLDMPQFIECVESRKYMFEVMQDKQDALGAGINSTPTILLNGRKLVEVKTEQEFNRIIEKELETQKTTD